MKAVVRETIADFISLAFILSSWRWLRKACATELDRQLEEDGEEADLEMSCNLSLFASVDTGQNTLTLK